jgi:RNA polymerase sigma-70 factor, ECF subfamily
MLTVLQATFGADQYDALENSAPRLGTTSSDTALIDAIAGGDRRAMRLLYARHNVRVYRFARRLGADRAAAEDIVSEVFLAVWRKAGGFQGRSQFSTWLLGVTRNKTFQYVRRPRETLGDAASEMVVDDADTPDLALEKKQTGAMLLEALKHVSPAHREVIDLVYYHSKTIDEVARILNIPLNTVKTRMFNARRRLAQALLQAGHDKSLLQA